jgi:hypothetical protein
MLEIDTETLSHYKLNAHQFLVAYLVYKRQFQTIENYLEDTSSEITEADIKALTKSKLIKNHNTDDVFYVHRLEASPSAISLFATGDFFDELLDHYPVSVRRPSGQRDFLRTNLKNCRQLYKKITKEKKQIHDHIVRCLDYEVNIRKQEGSLSYMKKLVNWLNGREWEAYEQAMQQDKRKAEEEEISYGTKIE